MPKVLNKKAQKTVTLPREIYELLLKRGEKRGRNSKTLTIRIPNDAYELLQQKATRRGTTIGIYTRDLVVKEGTRSHQRGEL